MADPVLHAVKTYRYLRVAMVVLVLGLGAALVVEAFAAPGCLQTSISGYYYTPVRPFFVSALLAIGVCLVVLKGSTELEDALLNAAGMLAPVVAFVPTPDDSGCTSEAAVGDASASIGNNMSALFVLGAVGLVLAAVLLAHEERDGSKRASWWGLAGSVLLVSVAFAVFWQAREAFEGNAHYFAAIPMFVCIVAVVLLNAVGFGREQQERGEAEGTRAYVNRYLAVAVSMLVGVVAMLAWDFLADWEHLIFGLEVLLLSLFAAFWLVQTHELWGRGLRPPEPASPRHHDVR